MNSENYKVYRGREISFPKLLKMFSLYNSIIKTEYKIHFFKTLLLMFKTIDGYIMIYNTKLKRVAGMTVLYSLKDEFVRDFKSAEKTSFDVGSEDCNNVLKPAPQGYHHFYCGIVGVDPAENDSTLAFRVLNELSQFMSELADKGVYADEMIADIASNNGGRLASMLGFKFVTDSKDGMKLYSVSLLPFEMRYKSDAFNELRRKYEEKFAALN